MRPNLQAPTPQRPAPPPGNPPRRSRPSPPIATARAKNIPFGSFLFGSRRSNLPLVVDRHGKSSKR
eukprot:1622279-Pyramimonas_sp.AAC.1